MGVAEPAKGIQYEDPHYILAMSEARHNHVRKKLCILVEGGDVPPPIK
jgi:hypothetical protein